MTNNQLTRERLQEIAEDGFLKHGESKELARMALAAMGSEPVAWTSEEAIAEVYCDETGMIGPKYMIGDVPLYRHAQPAPVVPDDVLEALQKVARLRLDLKDFDGDRRGIADCLGDAEEAHIEVVNRRAAMLAAAPQEAQVVPEKIEQSRKRVGRCDVCTEGARGGCGTCIFNGNFE
ncbi:TPA: DUF550 domain-containing protein [Klebsiella aerogenes]|nr:DUF550 domain-containing protein [Klebsiella aerogenes]